MHLVQSFSLVLCVALATAALASFAQIFLGAEQGRQLASERGGAQFMVIPAGSESLLSDEDVLFTGAPATMYMPESTYEKVLQLEGVTRATFQFYSQTLDASCCSASSPTRLIGIDPATDFVVSPLLATAGNLEELLQEGTIIIGSAVDGFESGSGEVLGKPQQVSAVLAATGTDLDHSIIVHIAVARAISAAEEGYEHFWDRYGEPESLISALLVDFDDAALQNSSNASNRLMSLGDVKVLERSVIIEQSAAAIGTVLTVLAGAGGVIALASFLQLIARFTSMVWERRVEFALYKALGAGRATVLGLIGGEAVMLTSAGLLIGVLLSLPLIPLLLSHASATGSSFAFVSPSLLEALVIFLLLVVGTLLLAMLSVVICLGRLAKIEPSLALRQVDIG